ncbi:MAG TPA: Sec-independent protein translocase subunit TatA [Promicromonospora sp.]|nr:Sec-independent protein translocase subunit TatA [Promicromonospora sp.]
MGAMQPWHWIVLLVVILLLFGSTRLPGLAKSVGQSMKIFRKEMRDLRDDDKDTDGTTGTTQPGAGTTGTSGTTGSSGQVPGIVENKDRDIPKA